MSRARGVDRPFIIALTGLLSVQLLAGCGSDSGNPGGADERAAIRLDSFVCTDAGPIVEGMNTLIVGGRERAFHVESPASTNGPLGLVFSWHGFNDPGSDGDAAGWRAADQVDPNSDPQNPTIVVTPIDIDFNPPVGLDWQLDKGVAAENVDLAFFEAMLGCLDEQFTLDPTRIYSYGFSAGSVMTSLIHSAYPELVPTVALVSGMWFNDPAEVAMIQIFQVDPSWPQLSPDDGGAVLMTHGGPNDITVLNVANLEDMAQAALPFLAAANRLVVDCPHGDGHALNPELSTAQVMRFFADHRAGQPSPYATDNFAGYPASCVLREP